MGWEERKEPNGRVRWEICNVLFLKRSLAYEFEEGNMLRGALWLWLYSCIGVRFYDTLYGRNRTEMW
jgi:hypothetical protein